MTKPTELLQFEAVIEKHPDLNAAYITIPFKVQEVFGSKGQVKIKATINGKPFRASLAPMGGGNHVLGLRKELREMLGINFGDVVMVKLEHDHEPRIIAVPEDLQTILTHHPELNAAFEKLAYTHRREYVLWIEEAKKPETRQRRLEKTLELIRKNLKC